MRSPVFPADSGLFDRRCGDIGAGDDFSPRASDPAPHKTKKKISTNHKCDDVDNEKIFRKSLSANVNCLITLHR